MYKKDYEASGCRVEDYVKSTKEKPIVQYDMDGNFISEYKSARFAANATGIGYKLISRVCRGDRPHTHGYVFRFKDV